VNANKEKEMNNTTEAIEYKLAFDGRATSFSEQISKLLDEGWTLYGFPFATGHNYCQALTRPKVQKQ
jgi:hypothetical protein